MQYYNNPYYSEGYKLKPWFALTEEERSFITYQAYKNRVLSSDEVKGYLRTVRFVNASNLIFPIIAFPILKRTAFRLFANQIYFKSNAAASYGVQGTVVGLSWLAWINFSPLYTSLVDQREELLKTVEKRIGFKLLSFNDVLPRWLTIKEIHRQMQEQYNERNSIFTGYLYAHEENAEPLIDPKTLPKKIREKITK